MPLMGRHMPLRGQSPQPPAGGVFGGGGFGRRLGGAFRDYRTAYGEQSPIPSYTPREGFQTWRASDPVQAWMAQRPQRQGFMGARPDFRAAMQAWIAQRPDFSFPGSPVNPTPQGPPTGPGRIGAQGLTFPQYSQMWAFQDFPWKMGETI
jgi:hypothetical protein